MDYQAWLDAFKQEHGYLPWEDPGLLALGFTPEQALQEHLTAKQAMEGIVQATGQPYGQNPQDWQNLWHARWDDPNYKLPSWSTLGTSLAEVVAAGTQSKSKETQYSAQQMAQMYQIDLSPFTGGTSQKSKKGNAISLHISSGADGALQDIQMAAGLIGIGSDIPTMYNLFDEDPQTSHKIVVGRDANNNPIYGTANTETYNKLVQFATTLSYLYHMGASNKEYQDTILAAATDIFGGGIDFDQNPHLLSGFTGAFANTYTQNAGKLHETHPELPKPQSGTAGQSGQQSGGTTGTTGQQSGGTTGTTGQQGGGNTANVTPTATPTPTATTTPTATFGATPTPTPTAAPQPVMTMVTQPNGTITFMPTTQFQNMLAQQNLGYPPIAPPVGAYPMMGPDGNIYFLNQAEYQAWLASRNKKR